MSYPSSLDGLPTVSSGALVTSTGTNNQINAINAIETALGTNPFGSYTDVKTAIANKLDVNSANMGGNKITNMATPTASGDAATKGYVDSSSLALAVDYTGTTQGTRRELNFIPSGTATVTVADNPGANRVDVTIGGVGGGSSGVANIDEDLGCIIDGGGSTPATGLKAYRRVDFACTILEVDIVADVSGSAVIDIYKDTFAHLPLTSSQSICGGNYPTLSSAQTSSMTSFTSWTTTTINAGDFIGFALNSASTVTRLTVILKVQRAINTLGNSVVNVVETIGITIDGDGGVPATGLRGGAFKRIDYAATITGWTLVGNASGSCVIDVWKTNLAGIPSISSSDSITASAKPTLSSQQAAQSSTLTGWTVGLSAGDFLGFDLSSISSLTRVTLFLTLQRT